MSDWIRCDEELPPLDVPVFVATAAYPDQLGCAMRRFVDDGWYWEEYNGNGMDFRDGANYIFDDEYMYKWWMNLPPPPE